MGVRVFLVVAAAFCDDSLDFGDAVLDSLLVGNGDALAFDFALGHALPDELGEDIAGEDGWSLYLLATRSCCRVERGFWEAYA